MEDTIFGKIIRREIPADIVYEDEETLAFLDIHPASPGHTLVVPKKAVRNIFDIDETTLTSVMRTVQKIAPGVRDGVHAQGLNIISNHETAAGQIVFHFHVHLIPRFENDGLKGFPKITYTDGQAATIAADIRAAIG